MWAQLVPPSPLSVIASYARLADVEEAVRDLDDGKFPVRQITLIWRDPDGADFIVAGSLSSALFDSIEEVLCGAGAEEFLRGLMAWGVSEQEVLAYQGMVRAGKFLIVSHGSSAQVAKAHRILQANGALAWRIHGSPAGVLEGAGLRAGGSDEMADEGSLSLS